MILLSTMGAVEECAGIQCWGISPVIGGIIITMIIMLASGTLLFGFTSTEEKPKPKPKNPPRPDSEEKYETSKGGYESFPSIDDPSTLALSVIVPAYNEESRIPVMLDETLEHLQLKAKKDRLTSEIIVVDDGSADTTSEVVLAYVRKYGHNQIRLLRLQQNQGKGGAVRMGMLRARGELLVMADADAATKFSDVDKLMTEVGDEANLVVVVGSRRKSELQTGRSFTRRLFSYGFNLYTKVVGGVYGLEDTQCGFKLYSRDVARQVFPGMQLRRWAFDVESLYRAQRSGARFISVPVTWTEIPGSKLSVVKATINMARDILLMRYKYVTGIWK